MTEDRKVEDPVLVLKREWDVRLGRYDSETDESDEAMDPLFDQLMEAQYAILCTPATTLAGVAVKLWLWTRTITPEANPGPDWWKAPLSEMSARGEGWLEFLPIASALQDLERLAGEARS